ncbi:MAG: RNA polymerase sigma factor [bacterium]
MSSVKNNSLSDEENLWIQNYLNTRDKQYLGKLYERYKQKIFMRCLHLVKNTEDAKDLASEAFIKAFNNIEKFKSGSPFYPWLSRIAGNLCIDHLRKQSRYHYQQILEEHAVIDPDSREQTENQKTLKEKIWQILQMLKPPQRRCFSLFYIHHLSYGDIADLTGYPMNQVRSYIQNGRRRFKILMEKK